LPFFFFFALSASGLGRRGPAVDERGLAAALRLFQAQALAFQPVAGALRLAGRAIGLPFLGGIGRIVEGQRPAVRAGQVGVGIAAAPGSGAGAAAAGRVHKA